MSNSNPPGSNNTSTTRQSTLSQVLRAGAGTGYGMFVSRNFIQQQLAMRGHIQVDPSTRLGAMMHSMRFTPGTVGFGVFPNISAIHSLMGGIGQSNIGALFGSQQAQQHMAAPIHSDANSALANMEHGYWRTRLAGAGARGVATIGERFGGLLGTAAFPPFRALLQTGMQSLRNLSPMMALRSTPALAVAASLYQARQAFSELRRHQ